MLIHVEVAIAFKFEFECAVTGEQLQHVIEEANASGDLVMTAAFNGELDGDACFGGVTFKARGARG
jgi:hypothetical protein